MLQFIRILKTNYSNVNKVHVINYENIPRVYSKYAIVS
jgi:hypothetical protein